LLYYSQDRKADDTGLWALPMEGDRTPFLILTTGFHNYNYDARFSPDGHWIAYTSDESGRAEIYVRTFSPDSRAVASGTGGKWLVSTQGGSDPRWRRDGRELYYISPSGDLMAVEISATPTFQAGLPKALFHAPPGSVGNNSTWDVTADGKRFLFADELSQTAQQPPFIVVMNWPSLLKK
jgi:eukaryotic-like serine/threonine-protein kinase